MSRHNDNCNFPDPKLAEQTNFNWNYLSCGNSFIAPHNGLGHTIKICSQYFDSKDQKVTSKGGFENVKLNLKTTGIYKLSFSL